MLPRINLISGSVELTEAKSRRRVQFTGGLAVGNDEATIRRNFRYSRMFAGARNAKQRKAMEELEQQGRVRLIEFKVDKVLGHSVAPEYCTLEKNS